MIRFELLKLLRSRRPLIAAVALGLFLALMLIGFYLYAHKQTSGRAQFHFTFENQSYFNGLTFTMYAFYFGFVLLLPVFLATEGGAQIAGESASGSLQLVLARPVSRTVVFATKAAVTFAYAGVLTFGLLAACLLVGLVAIGWGDLTLYPGVLQMTDVYQHLPRDQALARFALVWPFATIALAAPLAMSLCMSVFLRNPVNAAGAAVSLYLVLHVISGVPYFSELRPLLFTTYLGSWRELLHETIDWRQIGSDLGRLLFWTCGFLGVALAAFRRREEP